MNLSFDNRKAPHAATAAGRFHIGGYGQRSGGVTRTDNKPRPGMAKWQSLGLVLGGGDCDFRVLRIQDVQPERGRQRLIERQAANNLPKCLGLLRRTMGVPIAAVANQGREHRPQTCIGCAAQISGCYLGLSQTLQRLQTYMCRSYMVQGQNFIRLHLQHRPHLRDERFQWFSADWHAAACRLIGQHRTGRGIEAIQA